MEALLSKQEIANLIAAIRKGDISFSEEEAKFQEAQRKNAAPVDLFNLTKSGKEQIRIPNFDIIVDIFCRIYATTLTNKLQRTFSIQRSSMETMKYEEFMSTKGRSGTIGVLSLSSLSTGALVVFNQHLSFSILEIMLGAAIDIDSPVIERRLTTLEINILRAPFTDLCPDIRKAFAQVGDIRATLEKLEGNARLVSITKPDEEVIVATLQVVIRKEIGKIYLLFPIVAFEPLQKQLRELLKISSQKGSTWRKIFAEQVQHLPMNVTAKSGEFTLTIRDLLRIKEGDILETNYDMNQPLQVLVEGRHKFNAIPGTHNGNKAISLIDSII